MRRWLLSIGAFGGAGLLGISLVLAQTTGPADVEIERFVLPGTTTTGLRVHGARTEMSLRLPAGDIWAEGGYKVAYTYAHGENIVPSVSNSAIPIAGTTRSGDATSGVPYQRLPSAGSVIGIALASSAALTLGAAHGEAIIFTVGGQAVRTGFTVPIGAGLGSGGSATTQYNSATRSRLASTPFTAGQAVGCHLTTDARMAPASAELACTIIVEQ